MAHRVLAVDDDLANAELWTEMLTPQGYDVESCASAAEAMERMAREDYDTLVTNSTLGGRADGYLVAGAMKTLHRDAHVVLVTSYPDFLGAWKAMQSAVDSILLKPVEVADLLQTLERVHKDRPLLPTDLAAIIDRQRSELIDAWLERVEADAMISQIRLARDERIDDLAEVIEAVARRIRQPARAMGEPRWEAARRHGNLRRRQDYRAQGVLREASILREVITTLALSRFLELDPTHLLADIAAMNAAIDEGMAISLEAFMSPARSS